MKANAKSGHSISGSAGSAALVIMLMLAWLQVPASAADSASMNLTIGGKAISGSIKLLQYDESILSPRDAASGQATGKQVYKPFAVSKQLDQSSVLLWQAITQNAAVEATILISHTNAQGAIEQYTVTLSKATIASMALRKDGAAGATNLDVVEDIEFSYQSITVMQGGKGATPLRHKPMTIMLK